MPSIEPGDWCTTHINPWSNCKTERLKSPVCKNIIPKLTASTLLEDDGPTEINKL